MSQVNGSEAVERLRKARNMAEYVIDGACWKRMDDEFKVSPNGLKGDYDTGASWVPVADLGESFTNDKTYFFGVP